MGILLGVEEIGRINQLANKIASDLANTTEGNFRREDIQAIYEDAEIAKLKAQIKKIGEWGNEDCPHAGYVGDDALLHKRECFRCWEILLKEAE